MASVKSFPLYCVFFIVVWSAVEGIPSQPARGTVKTIHTDDGDVIDCVDIYQQPSLDHPLLKNEKLKFPEYLRRFNIEHKNDDDTEDCPFATVPIRRVDPRSDEELSRFRKMKKRYFSATPPSSGDSHEHVSMAVPPGYYYGINATLNIWKPFVEQTYEFSLGQVWLFTGEPGDENFCSIEVGWQVYPNRHNNSAEPRLFTFWTTDDYETTGCYDLDCKGFMYIGKHLKYKFGMPLKPSAYNSTQYVLRIAIKKDQHVGDWFLYIKDYAVGYWPGALLSDLGELAEGAAVGGEVFATRTDGRHTKTQMGSGQNAEEGYKKAAYVRDIRVIPDRPYVDWVYPPSLKPEVSHPNCYSLDTKTPPFTGNGFFFGGNGLSNACP